MKKNITITFSNQKGGVGKSTLCAMFANYLKEKHVENVTIMDCDRQHSMVASVRQMPSSCRRRAYPTN